MKKKRFKIGDRVKCISGAVFNELNEIGTIVARREDHKWCVEFDKNVEGHSGSLTGEKFKYGHCVFVSEDRMQKLEEAPVPEAKI